MCNMDEQVNSGNDYDYKVGEWFLYEKIITFLLFATGTLTEV